MFSSYLSDFQSVLSKTQASDSHNNVQDLDQTFENLIQSLNELKDRGGRVYLVGNGGSSGIASHAAVDFVNACGFQAQAITDNSMLTCMANDYGYEQVFAQPLRTLINKGDFLLAISSSGNSKNIINACEVAKEKGAEVLTFSGFKSENPLRKAGHTNIWLDAEHYGYVEIGHAFLIHYLTDNLPKK